MYVGIATMLAAWYGTYNASFSRQHTQQGLSVNLQQIIYTQKHATCC
jgi:hypothetical protein